MYQWDLDVTVAQGFRRSSNKFELFPTISSWRSELAADPSCRTTQNSGPCLLPNQGRHAGLKNPQSWEGQLSQFGEHDRPHRGPVAAVERARISHFSHLRPPKFRPHIQDL